MHQYLKSIGFGNIRDKKQLIQIIRDVEESYTGHQLVTQDEVTDLCEFDKEYGEGIGIKVCGDMDIDEQFDYRYYAPYFTGSGVTSYANVSVERRIDREAYVGICEDTKVGINLVFYLQNMMEYLRERQIGGRSIKYSSVTLSGLCNEGTILLPVRKSKEQEREQQEEVHNRMLLLSAARTGDPQAIESLTLDDMDTYSMISKRVTKEDVYSIVKTTFMPYGIESDKFAVIGQIKEFHKLTNYVTMEELYVMHLESNDLEFDVCINAKDLLGLPEVGRRFKGNIWMQGTVEF